MLCKHVRGALYTIAKLMLVRMDAEIHILSTVMYCFWASYSFSTHGDIHLPDQRTVKCT